VSVDVIFPAPGDRGQNAQGQQVDVVALAEPVNLEGVSAPPAFVAYHGGTGNPIPVWRSGIRYYVEIDASLAGYQVLYHCGAGPVKIMPVHEFASCRG